MNHFRASVATDDKPPLTWPSCRANTYGVLDVREEFARAHPDAVRKILSAYEEARHWAIAHPAEFKALVAKATGLAGPVIDRQIDQRTDLSKSAIGEAQRQSIFAAGIALRKAGVIPASTDVKGAVDALIDTEFQAASAK